MKTTNPSMVLLNGKELVCYPQTVQPKAIMKDELQLDTTGTYLQVGTYKHKNPTEDQQKKKERQKLEVDFFTQHAFFFLKNADRIFNDSRMFLAPVPVVNGLAYMGTGGFRNPTLGIYLEWWINGSEDILKDKDGKKALTYRIAGSPLSGCNSCACVYPDGTTKKIAHSKFGTVWHSFIEINGRYKEAKQKFEAYSLREVFDILTASEQSEASELRAKLMIAEGRIASLRNQLSKLTAELKEYKDRFFGEYYDVCIKLHEKELKAFKEEYFRRKEKAETELDLIAQYRRELKAGFKQGLYDNIEYQKKLHPLNRQRKEIEAAQVKYELEEFDKLTKSGDLTRTLIMKYLNE